MTQPSVLSFDLDDTLWPIAPVIVAAENEMWEWLSARHPEVMRGHSIETLRAMRVAMNARYPQRSHDMSFLRHRALVELFGEHSDAERFADDAFEVFYAARNRVSLYDDVGPALARLHVRYRLFGLSNGNADLERCGLASFFEGHVSAISAGAAKPDVRIFNTLVQLAGVAPSDILHVGDDPALDVDGAARAGLQTAWLNRDGRPWPDTLPPPSRTIATLAELS